MSREQIIRDTAYAIWEAEGRPDGRAAEHWMLAEEQVAEIVKAAPKGATKSKAVRMKAPGAPAAAAKPAAKAKAKVS